MGALRSELERITEGPMAGRDRWSTDGSRSEGWAGFDLTKPRGLGDRGCKALALDTGCRLPGASGKPERLFGWDEFDGNTGDEGF
jgi:hypothetical protein